MIDIMKLLITGESLRLINVNDNDEDRDDEQEPDQIRIDEDSIGLITGMGFSRGIASAALRRTYGNVEQAIELALTGGISPEEEKQNSQLDAVMEEEQKVDTEKDKGEIKMEVDDPEILVINRDKLIDATKEWLKMLFNWILTGFNSSLTDLDMVNITQFMLKFVTSDEEVETLMKT